MEAAAAEMRFEQAAVLRDRIQALNTVRERQKIISTEESDQDIVGVVRQGPDACVQLFFVRQGRLLGRESFFFDRLAGASDGEVLSAFVRQFYARNVVPAARDPALGDAPSRSHRGVAGPAPRRARGAPRAAAGAQARAGGDGRGERGARAPEPSPLARQPARRRCCEELQRALGLARPAAPHRVLRHLDDPGQGDRGLDGGVAGRRHEEGRLQALQDPHGDGHRRLRVHAGGADAPLRSGAGEGGPLPDLILLDGGRGQLNAGIKALEDLGLDYVPIASLAKRAEEVYTPDRLQPLVLDLGSPALHTLQKIRDEAHRFAITYHKKLRQRRDHQLGAGPDSRRGADRAHEPAQDPGLGRGVREASVAELAAVPKVTPKLAQRIYDLLPPAPTGEPSGAGGG